MSNTTPDWDRIAPSKKMRCASCSGWMHKGRTSKPEGEAKCLPCKQVHGSSGMYKSGCRCQACKDGMANRARAYNARVKARDGVSHTAQFKRKAKGHDPIAGAEYVPCTFCKQPMKQPARSDTPMHKACRAMPKTPIFIGPMPEKIGPARARTMRTIESAVQGTAGKTPWTNGRCSECNDSYTAKQPSLTCSDKCSSRRMKRLHGRDRFDIPRSRRIAIFERDNWICKICHAPVDRDAHPTSNWYPSLDHIKPRSTQLLPDHSDDNLRCTHRLCNSLRGDGTRYADQRVKELVQSQQRATWGR